MSDSKIEGKWGQIYFPSTNLVSPSCYMRDSESVVTSGKETVAEKVATFGTTGVQVVRNSSEIWATVKTALGG